jgi:hypothetical protein
MVFPFVINGSREFMKSVSSSPSVIALEKLKELTSAIISQTPVSFSFFSKDILSFVPFSEWKSYCIL